MAKDHEKSQAEQSQQMARMEQELTEGSHKLVEADAIIAVAVVVRSRPGHVWRSLNQRECKSMARPSRLPGPTATIRPDVSALAYFGGMGKRFPRFAPL